MTNNYTFCGTAAIPQNQKNSSYRARKNRAEREARALRQKYERTLAEKFIGGTRRVNGVWVR